MQLGKYLVEQLKGNIQIFNNKCDIYWGRPSISWTYTHTWAVKHNSKLAFYAWLFAHVDKLTTLLFLLFLRVYTNVCPRRDGAASEFWYCDTSAARRDDDDVCCCCCCSFSRASRASFTDWRASRYICFVDETRSWNVGRTSGVSCQHALITSNLAKAKQKC